MFNKYFCFRFLTTGISFKALAFNFRVGFSTVRAIVHNTCAMIWKVLRPIVMPKPTEELWVAKEEDFRRIWNFPNCIGAIDGKHITIRAPHKSGSHYYNYKKNFSTVLLAVVDAKYRFVVVESLVKNCRTKHFAYREINVFQVRTSSYLTYSWQMKHFRYQKI